MPYDLQPLLIETICIRDGIPQHLPYHQARMADARRRLWGLEEELPLAASLQVPPEWGQGVVKCRVTYAGAIQKTEWEPYGPRLIRSLQLVQGDGLDYAFKYADRSGIAALMELRGHADDILIVQNGLITDTSYCNVLLYDGRRCYTPSKPLLGGTCRARLIDEGRIELADIRPAELKNFREIHLINAMLEPGMCVLPV